MLLYCNRSFLRLVLTHYGSIFMRLDNLIMGAVNALAAGLCQYAIDVESEYAPKLPHHYGMHALGVIVGFAVVFRTNLGWQRYWEAVSQLHTMYSKWGDAFSQAFAFASVSIESGYQQQTHAGCDKAARVEQAVEKLVENFTLLSALASDRLVHGDTSRMERRAAEAGWASQLVKREALRLEDVSMGVCPMPMLVALTETRPKTSRHASKFCRPGSSSEEPELHTQYSCVSQHREGVANTWEGSKYVVKRLPSEEERSVLTKSVDRPTVVMYWIIHELATLSKDIDAAPPIQSRMYQELSNGMLGFNQAVKLSDVPFPFPYAQMMSLLLVCYYVFIPVYIVVFTQSAIAGPILAFLLFMGIWGLNETAKELENPFGTDVNDIVVADFHGRFVELVMDVYDSHLAAKYKPPLDCS